MLINLNNGQRPALKKNISCERINHILSEFKMLQMSIYSRSKVMFLGTKGHAPRGPKRCNPMKVIINLLDDNHSTWMVFSESSPFIHMFEICPNFESLKLESG